MSVRTHRPFDELAALPPEIVATYFQYLEDEADRARER